MGRAVWGGAEGERAKGLCFRGGGGVAEDWGQLGSASENSTAQDLIKVPPPMDGARAEGFGKRNKLRPVGDTEL